MFSDLLRWCLEHPDHYPKHVQQYNEIAGSKLIEVCSKKTIHSSQVLLVELKDKSRLVYFK